MRRAPRPIAERFWPKVDKRGPDECWLWLSHRNKWGYGLIVVGSRLDGTRRQKRASRVVWELMHGPIPNGLWVLHHCDNPPCCNPAHLFLGTPSDNSVDMTKKGRNGAHTKPEKLPRGAHNGRAKLTEDDVRAIRARYKAKEATQDELATEFRVSQAQINNIVLGKLWVHLDDARKAS